MSLVEDSPDILVVLPTHGRNGLAHTIACLLGRRVEWKGGRKGNGPGAGAEQEVYLAVNWLGQRNLRASGERALSFSMVGANQQTLDISVFLLPLRYSLNLHAFRTRLLFALVSPPKIPARIGRGFASPGGLRKIVDKIYYIHVSDGRPHTSDGTDQRKKSPS